MAKIAVILAGCGHKDGSEIREAVLTLLALDRCNAVTHCFAPERLQADVVNHYNGQAAAEQRNILHEAARVARGDIKPLSALKAKDFDGLILPGGFGAAKNFSTLLTNPQQVETLTDIKQAILAFHHDNKPIGCICIAPIIVAAALKGYTIPHLTVGEANDTLTQLGATQEVCASDEICIDKKNKLVSCSAYMRDDRLSTIADGIDALVKKIIQMT